ncbi:hypothetical protein N9W83_05725 [Planktomarina temperata]|nr:hypothetical protein [bacterium]MDB2458913.1 hypothetical protein [Planktomarina temperata]
MLNKANCLFGLYIFLILSDWVGNFLPMPLGVRHVALLTIPVLLMSSFVAERRTLLYFFILTLIAVCSYANQNAELFNFSVGYLFTFLFLFVHIIFFNINLSDKSFKKLLKLIVHANVLLALPTLVGGLSDFDLRNHPGVFREVGAFATTMMCSQIICLFLYRTTNRRKYLTLAVAFSVICLITILKKTMFLSLCTWVIYSYFYLNWKAWFVNFRAWIIGIMVSVVMAAPLSQNFAKNASYLNHVGIEEHVRLGMYVTSFKLVGDYFPFGSGLGTFGSFGSIVNNVISDGYFDYQFNNIYYRYGIDDLAGNSEERAREGGMTILDTYWPHILGELGIFGFIAMFLFWVGKIFLLARQKNKMYQFKLACAFYICATYLAVIGEGLALIQPELPFFIYFHAGLGGLMLNRLARHETYVSKTS